MKILIIRLSSIGDIILTTPVIKAIRDKYPKAEIHFLVADKFKEAITENKNIDKVCLFNGEKYKGINGIYNFSKELRKENYDMVIDLHSKIRSKLISFFIKGKKTYRYKKRVWWKTLLVKMKFIKYSADDTIVKNYFNALTEEKIYFKTEELEFNFEKAAEEKVNKYKKIIVFAPGASKNTKKWPRENFAKLGKILIEKTEESIVIIGGKNEETEIEWIKEEIGDRAINLAGKLSLKESGALIKNAEFIVTNDSGPFHIARGVKTISFVLFGPTDPKMFDYNKDDILLYAGEKCSPCSLHGDSKCPKKHFKCMKNITPEMVFEKIRDKLKKNI